MTYWCVTDVGNPINKKYQIRHYIHCRLMYSILIVRFLFRYWFWLTSTLLNLSRRIWMIKKGNLNPTLLQESRSSFCIPDISGCIIHYLHFFLRFNKHYLCISFCHIKFMLRMKFWITKYRAHHYANIHFLRILVEALDVIFSMLVATNKKMNQYVFQKKKLW